MYFRLRWQGGWGKSLGGSSVEWFSGNRELIAEGNHSIGAAVANMFFFCKGNRGDFSCDVFFFLHELQ